MTIPSSGSVGKVENRGHSVAALGITAAIHAHRYLLPETIPPEGFLATCEVCGNQRRYELPHWGISAMVAARAKGSKATTKSQRKKRREDMAWSKEYER